MFNGDPVCPECESSIKLAPDALRGEILVCRDCGVELELVSVSPVVLELLKPDELDFGE